MATFKTLTPNDVSRVPFNANKQFNFTSASAAQVGIHCQTFEYATSSLDSFSSASTDPLKIVKYYQLDHLFYKDHRLDISNKLGDADYLNQSRILYDKVNILSIPSNLYGNKIKPGTFKIKSGGTTLIDDQKGNLIVSGTQLDNYFLDERAQVLFVGPVKAFKKYNLNYDLYGFNNPNPVSYYNKENIYDDSYYNNTITYKNILFKKENHQKPASNQQGNPIINAEVPSLHFMSNGSLTSSVVAPHSETYNFERGEDFTISFFVNPVSASNDPYLISKSTKESILKTPIYQPLYTTGSSQISEIKTKPQYPFEIFFTKRGGTSENLITFRRSDGTNVVATTTTGHLATGSMHHIVCRYSASKMEIFVSGSLSSGTTLDTTKHQTGNKANLYIGSKGESSNFFTGSMSNIKIFNRALSNAQISNLSSSINGSPYIGNIFYSNGLLTSTHPHHKNIFSPINAQLHGYYPLNDETSSNANNGSGSFLDSSRYNYDSTGYFYVNQAQDAAVAYNTNTIQSGSFETITHNNATVTLKIFSASLSSSANQRGREYIKIPNQDFQNDSNWSLAWIMKESPGFHNTHSVFMGQDQSTLSNEMTKPNLWIRSNGKLSFRDKQMAYWESNNAITNRSESAHYVITYDSSDKTNATMDFYENGILIGSASKNVTGSALTGSFNIEALGSGYYTTGDNDSFGFSGSLGQVMFFNYKLTTQSIALLNSNVTNGIYGSTIESISFKNIHPIYENEYMCTVNADEFNYTHNISTRKIKTDQHPTLADFATSSLFKPYVTTVGLYNEHNELLVVGKLGQPVRMSDETDTTFVLRWDT